MKIAAIVLGPGIERTLLLNFPSQKPSKFRLGLIAFVFAQYIPLTPQSPDRLPKSLERVGSYRYSEGESLLGDNFDSDNFRRGKFCYLQS